mmetsp:Transcript_5700/g.16837  ORF Transcript_5700/g.16837 Transcript_5700/m.16837 type:complete len:97 (-) Transcript_5700:682-972(-)
MDLHLKKAKFSRNLHKTNPKFEHSRGSLARRPLAIGVLWSLGLLSDSNFAFRQPGAACSGVDSSVRFCEDVQVAIYLILSENMATRVTRDDHCLNL